MVDQLHSENFHLMISVWPFFEPGSSVYDDMEKRGWFVDKFKFAKPPYHTDAMAVYDATNPEARKYYWHLMDQALFKIGIDAWWLDTTEPETEGQEENILLNHKPAIGSGDRYVNVYPLMTTGAVYDGQRSSSDKKRVMPGSDLVRVADHIFRLRRIFRHKRPLHAGRKAGTTAPAQVRFLDFVD